MTLICLSLQLEEEEEREKVVVKKEPPRFQLSSLNPQERIDYSHLIEELGVCVCRDCYFLNLIHKLQLILVKNLMCFISRDIFKTGYRT